MAFLERKIDIRIQLNGDSFNVTNAKGPASGVPVNAPPIFQAVRAQTHDTAFLEGLRCQATIQSTVGGQAPLMSQAQLRVYGMRGDDMAKLSTLGFEAGTYKKNRIDVFAGDDVRGLIQLFSGSITNAFVDYNAMPDVGVEILAFAGFNEKMTPIAGSSYKGAMDVATIVRAICNVAGLAFVDHGVTAKLSNHAVGGTAIDQITDICNAAQVQWTMIDGTVFIWPKDGTRDDTIIEIDAKTGLVGYPMYTGQGIDVVSEFNPAIQVGRRMKVTSSIPNLNPNAQLRFARREPEPEPASVPGGNGTWYIWGVTHELESQTPNGKWFTRASLGTIKNAARPAA